MNLKKLHLFILVFTLTLSTFAQTRNLYMYAGSSLLSYKGDLSNKFNQWSGGWHLGIQNRSNKRLYTEFQFLHGQVSASNPNYTFVENNVPVYPNTFFQSTISQTSFLIHLQMFKKYKLQFHPYIGTGILFFKSKDIYNNELKSQVTTRAALEEYNTSMIIVPMGFKMVYNFSPKVSLGLVWNAQSTGDYIDNISKWGTNNKKDKLRTIQFSAYFYLTSLKKQEKIESTNNVTN